MTYSATDHAAMASALRLAEKGLNTTTPNPRVGCVLVSDGVIVGEGWHRRAGEAHAEALALRAAGERARGATAYVTLEPCAHFGRTPPCADALIAAGVRRVVAAIEDPNPLVAGQGMARLRAAGIDTSVGLLADEAAGLNIGFISRMRHGRPWIRIKAAATLDGKTALENGVSQWITGAAARRDGHRWRARASAVLTGIGTVLKDDPRLDVREVPCERQPLRIVLDARLDTPPQARILQGGNCLIVCASNDKTRQARLADQGAELLVLPEAGGRIDLDELVQALAQRQLNEVHVEAGAKLNGALLKAGYADELLLYLAPILAGNHATGLFDFPALTELTQATRLTVREVRNVGEDIRLIARFLKKTG